MREKVAVVGVGNILLGDEGVGVHIIEHLKNREDLKNVKLIDAGTAFLDVIYELDGYDKVIIVDAVNGDGEPGSIYRINVDEVLPGIGNEDISISLHDYGLIEGLSFSKMTNINMGEVVLIGIEPEKIETFTGLSPKLSERLGIIEKVILDELGII